MNAESTKDPIEKLAESLASGDTPPLVTGRLVSALAPRDLRRLFGTIDLQQQATLLDALPPEEGANILNHLAEPQATDILEFLPPETAADLVELLPSAEGSELIRHLEEGGEYLLDEVEDAEGRIRLQSSYPEDTAGALMERQNLSVFEQKKVGHVLDLLAEKGATYREREVQYIYATDKSGILSGVIPLRDLVMASRDQPVAAIMIPEPASVLDIADLNELTHKFEERKFLGLPVTDASGHLLGVITRSAVQKAAVEHASDDYLKAAGIVGGEELRSMPLLERSKKRVGWLLPNIALNLISASVIAFFQDTLEAAIALAVFLPIVSDMSGCSGNQAVAVSVRELTLGILRQGDYLRVIAKEALVGVLNGISLGIVLGIVAFLWKQDLALALVVGSALAINTLVSVTLGGIIPLALRRIGADPALASSPILTTCTDMCGFLLVLGIATVSLV
jgi:magnesium transporter